MAIVKYGEKVEEKQEIAVYGGVDRNPDYVEAEESGLNVENLNSDGLDSQVSGKQDFSYTVDDVLSAHNSFRREMSDALKAWVKSAIKKPGNELMAAQVLAVLKNDESRRELAKTITESVFNKGHNSLEPLWAAIVFGGSEDKETKRLFEKVRVGGMNNSLEMDLTNGMIKRASELLRLLSTIPDKHASRTEKDNWKSDFRELGFSDKEIAHLARINLTHMTENERKDIVDNFINTFSSGAILKNENIMKNACSDGYFFEKLNTLAKEDRGLLQASFSGVESVIKKSAVRCTSGVLEDAVHDIQRHLDRRIEEDPAVRQQLVEHLPQLKELQKGFWGHAKDSVTDPRVLHSLAFSPIVRIIDPQTVARLGCGDIMSIMSIAVETSMRLFFEAGMRFALSRKQQEELLKKVGETAGLVGDSKTATAVVLKELGIEKSRIGRVDPLKAAKGIQKGIVNSMSGDSPDISEEEMSAAGASGAQESAGSSSPGMSPFNSFGGM